MRRALWFFAALFLAACGGMATPTDPIPTAGVSTAPVVLSSIVGTNPGGQASATVTAAANTRCTIAYTAPDGRVARLPTLGPKTTDAHGRATWSWYVPTSTARGIGMVAVECGGVTRSERILIGVVQ
jgi:hypothetical protein